VYTCGKVGVPLVRESGCPLTSPEILKKREGIIAELGVGLVAEQTQHGGFILGSTREYVGYNTNNSWKGVHAIAQEAVRIIPPLNGIRVVRAFAGLRPSTPDGKPFMGKIPGYEGLYVSAGHEGDGIALSPICGELMADLVTDDNTRIDISRFSVDRLKAFHVV